MNITRTFDSGKEISVPKFVWKHTGVIIGEDEQCRTIVAHNHPTKPKLVTREEFSEGETWSYTGQSNYDFENLLQRINQSENKNYSLAFENCQHFSNRLISGKSSSSAVTGTLVALGLVWLLYSSNEKKK